MAIADAKKFRFVSPGIFIDEVDQSQIPALPEAVGPVIIGRAEKGPGMIPVKINSFSEFVETFGYPIPGNGGSDDVWRDGNYSSPTYGAYAAQAYLRAGVAPITYVRLVGTQHADATTSPDGRAGWKTTDTPDATLADNGGPYGLFVWPSASFNSGPQRGALAAVWYCHEGVVPVLSGAMPSTQEHEGTAGVIKSNSKGEFKVRILRGASETEDENVTFSLSPSSDNFIRKAFNTNPLLVNGTIESSTSRKYYWLGETYERELTDLSLNTSTGRYGAIFALVSGSSEYGNHDKKQTYRDAHTGWFFQQNLSAATASYEYDSMQKLFKFVGINGHGQWLQNNVKISISNIKAPSNDNVKYGTFDVVIRKAQDADHSPVVLERYSACNLDPSSPDYIGRKIGDLKQVYDSTENRYREFGTYANKSRYVRVHIHDDIVNGGGNAEWLPFGVYGPPTFPKFDFKSGSAGEGTGHASTTSYALGSGSIAKSLVAVAAASKVDISLGRFVSVGMDAVVNASALKFGPAAITGSAIALRQSASDDGATAQKNAYFGLHSGKSKSNTVHDPGYGDYLRAFANNIISNSDWSDDFGLSALPGSLEYQWKFSLDEVIPVTGSNFTGSSPTTGITDAGWVSGSYKGGNSWNATNSIGLGNARYKNILDSKVNRFTSPMFGGFDALDITERDPFRNTRIDDTETETGNYTYNTIKRAINTVADPEVVECNIMSMPGLTNESLTKYMIDICEERADALAVIDLKGGFTPRHESSDSVSDRKGNIDTVLTNLKDRNLNNSYGCTYYPWVQIRDDNTNTLLYAPPSVVALGVLANTEKTSDVWFAPAGFQRGGLSQGAGGIVVTRVETKLTSRNRDDLYDININPIASFPAEGIVVFGQKTLQATHSALDRINVRRLLIYAKRGISQIASTTLFQPNVRDTWNAFKGRAENFLSDVKVRFGVDDFKIILDETTTTPDLIDRNIMYAKIFIKPTRAIEFIAIDFIITRSGASFED
jgi:hypothetical protein